MAGWPATVQTGRLSQNPGRIHTINRQLGPGCRHALIRCRQQRCLRLPSAASDSDPKLPADLPTFFDSSSDATSLSSPQQQQSLSAQPAQEPSPKPSTSASEPPKQAGGLRALLNPLSDPACNARLVALCSAQALCSVATLIHDTYLPVYLQDVLGLSNTKIGNLQAIAQLLCNLSKSVSGTLADILSPAKMVIFGTLLTTINKPMFAMSGAMYANFGVAATLYWVTAGKVFDRMSKGVREAPSKALIGELARQSGDRPEGAFGLRQTMATFGALLGATVAGVAFKLSGQNFILTFALATIPAGIALFITTAAFGQQGGAPAAKKKADEAAKMPLKAKIKALLTCLRPAYWQALIVVSLLYFARFDASFITLRAKTVLPKSQLPLLTSAMMVTQAFLAAPAGLAAKKSLGARNRVILAGYAAMIAADLSFALLPSAIGMFVGAALVGVHMALTHGVTLAMVASYIPTTEVPGIGKVSGTCWSFTDFIFGIILAYSNSVAGRLSDITTSQGSGNIGCFFGGTAATLLSGLALIIFSRFGELGREDIALAGSSKR